MKCSICGARLKKEGDICTSCYKEYQEEERVKNDNNVLYKVKRKYLPKYQLTQYVDWYIVFFLVFITFASAGNTANLLFTLLIFIVALGVAMFLSKLIAKGTTYTFYESKIKYNYHFLFIKREKILKSSDVTEASCYQTRRQKMFGLGDIRIYTKGNILINGLEMKNIADVEEVFTKVKEILNLEEK